ncbi:hypothetical protein H0E87_005545 [Populus deltoides]|uniref:Uncharacterized protein n=1 Tax=Populus deltoides TaxID=3696 RepID=A0A8T2ZK11_POPDE|nr:hypothetical protein H0E87_005545 [Populus deltoides]
MELTMKTSGGFGGEASFDLHDISWYDGDGSEASLVYVISSFALEFDKENNHAFSYTKVLPVPLTTPDFIMPYNVITITCTVFALYFGSLLSALRG